MEKSNSPVTNRRGRSTGTPPTWIVVCGAMVAQVGFGGYPVVVRKFGAEEKVNPYIFSFYRDAGAFPVLLVYSLLMEGQLIFPHLKMVPRFMLMGLSLFATQFLYITGVYSVGANIASVFQPLVPVWTTVISIATCIENVGSLRMVHTWVKFLGIILAAGGAVEITLTGGSLTTEDGDSEAQFSNTILNLSPPGNSTSNIDLTVSPPLLSQELFGYLALTIGTLTCAVLFLLQKKFIFKNVNSKWKNYPIATIATCYFFGALYMGLASTYFVFTDQMDEFRIPQSSYIALVYAIFITSALCFGLVTWTNKHLPASVTTAFWPVQIVITVLVSFAVTGEQLSPWQYIGAVMLVCGLMCVLYSQHKGEQAALGGREHQTRLLSED